MENAKNVIEGSKFVVVFQITQIWDTNLNGKNKKKIVKILFCFCGIGHTKNIFYLRPKANEYSCLIISKKKCWKLSGKFILNLE